MPHHGQLANEDEIQGASSAGLKGAVNGAATWGFYTGLLSVFAYFASPVYRNLTFQFKVYIQMSGMTLGSMIGAEKSAKDYEARLRRYRKIKRDAEVWRRYEEDYGSSAGSAANRPVTTTAGSKTGVNADGARKRDSTDITDIVAEKATSDGGRSQKK